MPPHAPQPNLSRQELTWLACDTLAAEGKKPSIGLVRTWTIATTGAKKGSDGDVQQDIHQWFEDLLKLKRDRAIADLPDAVSALARDFWRLAVDAANDALVSERGLLATEKAEMERKVALAREDTAAAAETVLQLTHQLALAGETLAGREDVIKRLETASTALSALLGAKEERIEGLSAELARGAAEHAAGLAELEGLRRHSLMQIDQARSEARMWKTEFERVDAENKSTVQVYRQKAAALENTLSTTRGRLGAVEETLIAEQRRNQVLELSLAAAKDRKLAAPATKQLSGRRMQGFSRQGIAHGGKQTALPGKPRRSKG